jgi:hypothetical protein
MIPPAIRQRLLPGQMSDDVRDQIGLRLRRSALEECILCYRGTRKRAIAVLENERWRYVPEELARSVLDRVSGHVRAKLETILRTYEPQNEVIIFHFGHGWYSASMACVNVPFQWITYGRELAPPRSVVS